MGRRKVEKNYNLLATYSYYAPGVKGVFALLLCLIVGIVLGNIAQIICILVGTGFASDYGMLISYPLMFVPAMIYASYRSNYNAFFEPGYALDKAYFSPMNAALCVLVALAATVAAAIVADGVITLLPPIPEHLEALLESMTQGSLWVNFLCVSIMAPFFEEWLCRGMILRGLLNCHRTDASGNTVVGLRPWIAISLSAFVFALIHANPWQAVAAFSLGCLFGYVYYKTGSLKLTMAMHFTNNTFALVCSRLDSFKDVDSWRDLLGIGPYLVLCAACILMIVVAVRIFSKITLTRPQGNFSVLSGGE